eukprot:XP_011677398.1 PREDICTED: transmembrane protein 101-like [Strongylocentrotus purpuratus]
MAAPTATRKPLQFRPYQRHFCLCYVQISILSALTLTMLCSERRQEHRSEGFPLIYVYIHIVVMFTCGTMMSFGSQRSLWAIVTAVSMAIFTTITQSQQPKSKMWLVARIASHDIGVIGVFLILASRVGEDLGKKYRLHFLYPYGKNLISIFCIISAVQLYRTPEERRAFLSTLPHSEVAMVILGASMLMGGFMFSSDFQFKRIVGFLSVALVFYILTIDGNLHYWHKKARLEYWMQMNMILNSATILCSMIFMAT